MSDNVKVAVFRACLWALFAAVCAVWAWMVATSEDRLVRAREEGRAEAQAEIDAAGGDAAGARKAVNRWCAEHGRAPAYTAEETEAGR